jgi:hypothetical protein
LVRNTLQVTSKVTPIQLDSALKEIIPEFIECHLFCAGNNVTDVFGECFKQFLILVGEDSKWCNSTSNSNYANNSVIDFDWNRKECTLKVLVLGSLEAIIFVSPDYTGIAALVAGFVFDVVDPNRNAAFCDPTGQPFAKFVLVRADAATLRLIRSPAEERVRGARDQFAPFVAPWAFFPENRAFSRTNQARSFLDY